MMNFVAGNGVGGLEVRRHGRDVSHDPGLVVGGAPAVKPAVPLGGLEGRREPLLGAAGGLHVVMAVKEDRRSPRRAEPIAVHVGVDAGDREDLDVLDAGAPHRGRDALRGPLHLRLREAVGRYARDAREVRERLLEVVEVRVHVADRFAHAAVRQGHGASVP